MSGGQQLTGEQARSAADDGGREGSAQYVRGPELWTVGSVLRHPGNLRRRLVFVVVVVVVVYRLLTVNKCQCLRIYLESSESKHRRG